MIGQIHIIPFDLGMVFYDEVSLDNTKNIELAEKFTEKMNEYCSQYNYKLQKNFGVENIGNKKKDYKFNRFDYARHCIFHVTISDELICYIISSGVGVFILNDLEGKYLDDSVLEKINENDYNPALIARYQKEYMQGQILSCCNDSKLKDINLIMLNFKRECWKTMAKLLKEMKLNMLRPYSACENYKSKGFSYVLTMYIINKNNVRLEDQNFLLYSTILKSNLEPSKWDETNKKINADLEVKPVLVKESESSSAYFSWSAVSLYLDRYYSIKELLALDIYKNMLKAEIYVQTRWFVGDNTLDNVRGKYYNLEKIERLIGLLQLTSSELDNETSANMNSFYKDIVKCIIETSSIKSLYKSASAQLVVQRNIKNAQYERAKSKNRLILNLILSIFTAISLAKTIKEFLDGDHSVRNWIIFGVTIVLAILIIVVNYRIDNKK